MFKNTSRVVLLIVAVAIFAAGIYFAQRKSPATSLNTSAAPVIVQEHFPLANNDSADIDSVPDVVVIAENLEIPWEIAFLPSGDMLVTERPGRLLKLGTDKTIIEVSGVYHIGEGGLLGLALHPDFAQNQFLYLYLTSQQDGNIVNRVERYVFDGEQLHDRTVILTGINGSQFHDGGRIAFGPDGYLYITTGDASQSSLAQDTNSLNGKILRITDDGSIPSDNPFQNPVYSYGHRNPQGLAWDAGGQLWATEHGRSGIQSGFDEVNRIEKGKNYGWPDIQGDQTQNGMEAPVVHSGATTTWAPAGAVFIDSSLFFTGLRGETLYEYITDGNVREHFAGEYGRLRVAVRGPDGMLYIATSNRDGRGQPQTGDDKIIRINPATLE